VSTRLSVVADRLLFVLLHGSEDSKQYCSTDCDHVSYYDLEPWKSKQVTLRKEIVGLRPFKFVLEMEYFRFPV
jgi:hypothetical protein